MNTIFMDKPVVWQKEMIMRARMAPQLVDGKFLGRHLIERDTPISGGVYASEGIRMLISVNGRSGKISGIYQKILETAGSNTPLSNICARHFLCHVMAAVRETLQNDWLDFLQTFEGVLKDSYSRESRPPEIRIDLDMLIEMQIADCRVYSLLSGALIERLIEDKFIIGRVSIDRNAVQDIGGHTWDRFTGADGEVTIIDATNNYLGDEESEIWPYRRP